MTDAEIQELHDVMVWAECNGFPYTAEALRQMIAAEIKQRQAKAAA